MAALAETPQYMIDAESSEPRLSLHGLAMPLTIRFAKAPSDEDVVRFSQQNQPYRIERNAAGELEIMSPALFRGGQREVFVMAMLFEYAQQHSQGLALEKLERPDWVQADSVVTGFRLDMARMWET